VFDGMRRAINALKARPLIDRIGRMNARDGAFIAGGTPMLKVVFLDRRQGRKWRHQDKMGDGAIRSASIGGLALRSLRGSGAIVQ
jgi:hypothetical protein